jgi:hypothetical protein
MAVAPQTAPERDGIYSHITDVYYHSDKNSLSSSGARTITSSTPMEYLAQLLEPPDPKPVYDVGHGCHKMVLGEGSHLVPVNARDWRTKAAQESRKKAWALGRVPLLKHQIETAQRMAGKVFDHHLAAKLLEAGSPELSGYWHDEPTGVRLRCRPDFLPDTGGRPLIVEYKTAASANPRRFARSLYDYGYHQQAAWNIDGLAACAGVYDAAFVFIVQQKEPPWLVSVCQLEPEDIAYGRAQNRAAIEVYAKCRESGVWPGYDGLYVVALPGWARHQIQDDLT